MFCRASPPTACAIPRLAQCDMRRGRLRSSVTLSAAECDSPPLAGRRRVTQFPPCPCLHAPAAGPPAVNQPYLWVHRGRDRAYTRVLTLNHSQTRRPAGARPGSAAAAHTNPGVKPRPGDQGTSSRGEACARRSLKRLRPSPARRAQTGAKQTLPVRPGGAACGPPAFQLDKMTTWAQRGARAVRVRAHAHARAQHARGHGAPGPAPGNAMGAGGHPRRH